MGNPRPVKVWLMLFAESDSLVGWKYWVIGCQRRGSGIGFRGLSGVDRLFCEKGFDGSWHEVSDWEAVLNPPANIGRRDIEGGHADMVNAAARDGCFAGVLAAVDGDDAGQFTDTFGLVPVDEVIDRVGSEQQKQFAFGAVAGDRIECVDGEGCAWPVDFDAADDQLRVPGGRQFEHIDSGVGVGHLLGVLVRRRATGHQPDGIQSELFTAFGHEDEVSVVDRVERTSVDAQFHVSLVRVSSRSCEAVFWFRRFLSVVSRVFAEREAVRIVPPVPDPRK